jgi:hypothetical protein
MSNNTPLLPLPEDDDAEGATIEVDGERRLDPDADDDLIDSADADVLAAETDDEDVESP